MGFRGLECFNLVLLAKQGWRLMHNTDYLVARIYSEKYYPNHTFLMSNVGSRPPYAWRSICAAKELLQAGLLWRVGDGRDTKVWHDRWIPSPTTYTVQSPVGDEARVSSLIDTDTNWWNKPLIQAIFNREIDILN